MSRQTYSDLRLLDETNLKVNRAVTHKKGNGEHWQPAPGSRRLGTGDCEDYAILKLNELARAGCDTTGMKIGVVRTRKRGGTLHAVLLVPGKRKTGLCFWRKQVGCTYVLDNMSDNLYTWEQTGYFLTRFEPASRWL